MTGFPSSSPSITVDVLARFPARVISGTGIKSVYAGGTLQIGLDFPGLPNNSSPLPTSQYQVLIYDPVNNVYQRTSLATLISFSELLVNLPTALPGAPGILWNNNGALSIS